MNPAIRFARAVATLVFATVAVVCATALSVAQLTPEVRPQVTVDGDYVMLSDLFTNTADTHDKAVFRAPRPGGSGTVQADRLMRVARDHGIEWTNPHRLREVLIERSGQLIAEQDVRDLIARTLSDKLQNSDADRSFEISFARDYEPLFVTPDEVPEADVVHLRFNRRTGIFTATLEAPAGAPAARRYAYTGRATAVQAVPVMTHTMRKGTVITEQDVEIRNVPVRKIDNNTVTQTEDLVGMAVTRTMRSGAAVKARDLERPRIVVRNRRVTIRYKVPGLVLTARAMALQSGAMDDIVNIRNMTSNRVIQARVIGPELVEAIVGSTRQIALTNQ